MGIANGRLGWIADLRQMLRGRQGCSDTGPSDKRTVELFYNTSTTVCRGMEPRGEENDGRQKNCDEPCHIGVRLRSVAVRVS
jgi:hypothetical protein